MKNFKNRVILVCSLAACFILAAAALFFMFSNGNGSTSLLQNDDSQQRQINNPTDNSRLSAAVKSSESADVIVNTVNETDKSVYRPDVKLLSNTLKLESSSKPGLPLTVGLSKGDKDNFNIKAISILVDYGTFLKWDSKTGVTSPVGASITIDTEETFFGRHWMVPILQAI